MANSIEELLAKHDVPVATDNAFQKRARLMQALWREEQKLAVGEHDGKPLGSRLAKHDAETALANFLTDTIRDVVRREVLDPKNSAGKLYGKPRIFNDLLSSQPLCFNLFGELQQDLALATRALRRLTNGKIDDVTSIGFEHSPGKGDPKYTEDRSAFDVFIDYRTRDGQRGFVGVEVKYHEALGDAPAPHRERYDVVASKMGCFNPATYEKLKAKPLQQIWRDHLLMGALRDDKEHGYADAFFAFAYPADNDRCSKAVASYRSCLTSDSTFVPWTLEEIVAAVKAECAGAWLEAFESRYLRFERIDALL